MKNKKKEVDYKKRAKIYGMIIVFCAFLLVGYLVKTLIKEEPQLVMPSEPTQSEQPTKPAQPEEPTQPEQPTKPTQPEEPTQNRSNIREIDEEITYIIQDGIKEKLNMKEFDEKFTEYCKQNMLLTYNTTAKCDGYLVENFSMQYIAFDLTLNNYSDTVVKCVIGFDNVYEFSHY